jgi:hypothetical protein
MMHNSVLQEWVMALPKREQGTLLTCVRGCDLTPKLPLDSLERRLVSALRAAFMNPADPREVDYEPGSFFTSKPPDPATWKASELGHYPLHWFSHVMHSAEILGYRHPDRETSSVWYAIYKKLAHSLHLKIETKQDMIERLSEDRIEKGIVVS